ncbi:MAG: acetolactate synthase small subunit [Deltaproteobacteria bacterium]|nr:acetolactate synthase small subunit [Deltaproteobacteria bacterium]
MQEREHIISMLVNNRPGVLSRISGVFGRLGYNIKSLCVAETMNPDVSRITLVSRANSNFTEKIKKNLDKLIDIVEVKELDRGESVSRELSLLGLVLTADNRPDILRTVDLFGCRILSITDNYVILAAIGTGEETATILNYLKAYEIKDLARTGAIAIEKGGGSRD